MIAVAERLHIDEDDILAWPYDKLQRWILYTEVCNMRDAVQSTFKEAGPDQVMEIVRQDQEKVGWVGVVTPGAKNAERE